MAASAGNVFNTLGKWSLTLNLIGLGLLFAVLFAALVWAPIDYAMRRNDPTEPATLGSTLKMVALLVSSMGAVALFAWLMYKSMKSTSTFGRRFRQFQGVSFLF